MRKKKNAEDQQENVIAEKWIELRTLIDMLEHEVEKNANGNVSAGVRCRRGFREVRNRAHELLMLSVKVDVELVAERKRKREALVQKD